MLSSLYTSLNAMDLSTLPTFSLDERLILRNADHKDLFEHKFESASNASASGATPTLSIRKMASGSSLLSGRSTGGDSAEVLGDGVLGMGGSGSSNSLSSLARHSAGGESSTLSASTSYGSTSFGMSSTEDLNALSLKNRSRANTVASSSDGGYQGVEAMRPVTPMLPRMGGGKPKDTHFYDTRIQYDKLAIPIRIPTYTFPEEVGDVSP